MFEVKLNKAAEKNVKKMPVKIQGLFDMLIIELKHRGPVLSDWHNFSKLGKNEYHCHLSRKWVACWKSEKNSISIEVYYAGSRENAPY